MKRNMNTTPILTLGLICALTVTGIPALTSFAASIPEGSQLESRQADGTNSAPKVIYTQRPSDGVSQENPFLRGTGGSDSFRIPALITLDDGTMIAAADARWNSNMDGGGFDTLVSRSADGGKTWSYTFANYLGDNGNTYNGKESTCFIDPSLATDGRRVYMLCDLYPYGVALNGDKDVTPSTETGFNKEGKLLLEKDRENHGGVPVYDYYLDGDSIYTTEGVKVEGYRVDEHFNITGEGVDSNLFFKDSPYKVARTSFFYLVTSDDGGKTWNAPSLVNVKNTSERAYLVGPGRGVVTADGTIVFPCYTWNNTAQSQKTNFIYSKDGGNSWQRSTPMPSGDWSSESAVVELKDGTLRFFYRNPNKKLYYIDYQSNKWSAPVNTGLDTSSNTQISAIKYSRQVNGQDVILVSCPTGPNRAGSDSSGLQGRVNGEIFVGLLNKEDNSIDWKKDKSIKVNDGGSLFLYSCLTEMKDGRIALLYENDLQENDSHMGFTTMDFKTFSLDLNFN